jgi:hypothetical protein
MKTYKVIPREYSLTLYHGVQLTGLPMFAHAHGYKSRSQMKREIGVIAFMQLERLWKKRNNLKNYQEFKTRSAAIKYAQKTNQRVAYIRYNRPHHID